MVRMMIKRRIRRSIRSGVASFALAAVVNAADFEVDFPAVKDGRPCHSVAVPVEDGSILVAVVLSGADASQPVLKSGGERVSVKVIGHDPVSRLCFLRPERPVTLGKLTWERKTPASPGIELLSGSQRARTSGWVKQVGTKVLPLALLRVNFDGPVPAPGAPLLTSGGKLAAVVFQQVAGANSAYALPVEALHRVRRDVVKSGNLVRGWLGLSMRAEIPTPQVTRVAAGSPADKVGIRANDVILQIGDRAVADYADSANAFFYLAPGEPVKMRLLRGADSIEVVVTPVEAPAREGAAR
jgi:S1-C subfamily serine protease